MRVMDSHPLMTRSDPFAFIFSLIYLIKMDSLLELGILSLNFCYFKMV
jgi:hypothetical protein